MSQDTSTVEELGAFFKDIEINFEADKSDIEFESETFLKNPTEYSNKEIEQLIKKAAKMAAILLAESTADRIDKALHSELAETSMERAFMLWEIESKGDFISIFKGVLVQLCAERVKARGSDKMYLMFGKRVFNETFTEFATYYEVENTPSDSNVENIVKCALEESIDALKNAGIDLTQKNLEEQLREMVTEQAEKLAQTYSDREEKTDDYDDSYYKRFERRNNENVEARERALGIPDPAEMGEDDFEQLIGYAMGVIVTSYSGLSIKERYEISLTALSQAVMSFNPEIAREKNARFGTHFTWQIRAVLKQHTRSVKKQMNGEKANIIGDDGEVCNDLIGIDTVAIQNAANKDEELMGLTVDDERLKKLRLGLRQIRHELPRITNHLIDLRFGEILKSNGRPYKNSEYAEIIKINAKTIGLIQQKGLKLIRAKMVRYGFVELIEDTDVSAEEMSQQDVFVQKYKALEESQSLAASLPKSQEEQN